MNHEEGTAKKNDRESLGKLIHPKQCKLQVENVIVMLASRRIKMLHYTKYS